MALGHWDVFRQINGLARCYICCGGVLPNDFGIAGNLKSVVSLLTVEDGQNVLAFVLAGNDVNAVIWDELGLRAVRNDFVALSPMKQTAGPIEHGILGCRASLAGEFVCLIIRETTGEVFADITIGYFLRAIHQDFRTVIELRCSVHRQQKSISLLEGSGVLAVGEETVGVVVLDECHHGRWVGIEIIVAQDVVDAVEPLPPCLLYTSPSPRDRG